jgi:hypothetical protein
MKGNLGKPQMHTDQHRYGENVLDVICVDLCWPVKPTVQICAQREEFLGGYS